MSRDDLRSLIREIISEAANATPAVKRSLVNAGEKIYRDNQGYQFVIRGGQLTLVKRPKGNRRGETRGLPKVIPPGMLGQTVTNLLTVRANQDDANLRAMVSAQAPAAGPAPGPVTPGLVLGNKTGRMYPVTREEILRNPDFKHRKSAGVKNCSEWAKGFVGYQGNAWIATLVAQQTKTVKVNIFDTSFSAYKAAAEKLFRKMNKLKGLDAVSSQQFNSEARAIVAKILPAPTALQNYMRIGDPVGMYYQGSDHQAEAFFEACSGWSFGSNSQAVTTCVKTKDGKPWNNTMLGKDLEFIITKPFNMNTHLGFVGGTLDGEPIIFHNMDGTVHVNRLSNIKSAGCTPVWVTQGNYVTAPPAGGGDTGAPQASPTDGGIMQRIAGIFSE